MSLYMPDTAGVALELGYECRNDMGGGDAQDAGAGAGGDTPADDQPAGDDTQDADTLSTDTGRQAGEDDDEGGDPSDDELADLKNDPRVRKLINRNRNLARWKSTNKPLSEAARALGVSEKDLRDVVFKARNFDAVSTRRASTDHRGAERPAATWQPPAFNRNAHPFGPEEEKNNPGLKWALDVQQEQHERYYELYDIVRQMAGELQNLHRGFSGERQQQVQKEWRTELDRAAALLPEEVHGIPVRTQFKGAVLGAFAHARTQGVRVDPKKVIAHFMGKFKPTPTGKKVATDVARQRIAETVRTLPGRSSFIGGAPAGARDRRNERVSDVTRRITGGRYVGGG